MRLEPLPMSENKNKNKHKDNKTKCHNNKKGKKMNKQVWMA